MIGFEWLTELEDEYARNRSNWAAMDAQRVCRAVHELAEALGEVLGYAEAHALEKDKPWLRSVRADVLERWQRGGSTAREVLERWRRGGA